jgi:hypothetical protein
MIKPRPQAERFFAMVEKTDDCWNWTGATCLGYGQFKGTGDYATRWAHRFAYLLLVGPIPDGLVLDHLCRNRACVNPDHLEPVTMAVNIGRIPRPPHCPKGHEFDAENTSYSTLGHRRCKTCLRDATRAYRARKAGAAS